MRRFPFIILLIILIPVSTYNNINWRVGRAKEQLVLNTVVHRIINCESSGIHKRWGDQDYKYATYGIAQFQYRTFIELAEKAGFGYINWKDRNNQLNTLRWAIINNYGYKWTCYRTLMVRR